MGSIVFTVSNIHGHQFLHKSNKLSFGDFKTDKMERIKQESRDCLERTCYCSFPALSEAAVGWRGSRDPARSSLGVNTVSHNHRPVCRSSPASPSFIGKRQCGSPHSLGICGMDVSKSPLSSLAGWRQLCDISLQSVPVDTQG